MELRLSAVTIERFRALRSLTLDHLGRVNLLTGRNNTGKSSVLEAIQLLASAGSPTVINRILRNREEDISESEAAARSADGEPFAVISSLFSGFPALRKPGGAIVISADGSGLPRQLALSMGLFTEEEQPDESLRLVPQHDDAFLEGESVPVLVVESETHSRLVRLARLTRRTSLLASRSEWPGEPQVPCVFISPYGTERTGDLGALWDRIALSDLEPDVVNALRIITPDIVAVSMIGGEERRQPRTAIVRSSKFSRPVPLRSFGEGVNRLFGIILSLVSAKGGLLLIDEVENGMHYSVQLDLWKTIFRLSRELDTQVFATSHSWDCVEAFQQAASEDPAEGVLIRLSRKGEDIVPTHFRERELAVATRDRIEVR